MFYDIFIKLCAEKGKRPSDVSRELEIGKSTISMWKKQNSIPNAVTLMQLAEYFNVTPAYLAGNMMAKGPLHPQKEKPIGNKDDGLDNVYFNFAKDAQDQGIDPDDIKAALELIKKFKKE